jgi:fibronectin-binding autotransporter adhesin
VVINSGVINGNVELGGSSDVVQLFTGSKINGSLSLSDTSSTLILDGAGQEILSQAVTGPLTNTGSLIKQGAGTWTIDRSLQAPLMTDILAGTLVLDAALDSPTVNISAGAFLQLNSGGNVANLVNNGLLFIAGSGTVNSTENISGTGSVVQEGTGTTILSGANSYGGGTIIYQGTLLVNNAHAGMSS